MTSQAPRDFVCLLQVHVTNVQRPRPIIEYLILNDVTCREWYSFLRFRQLWESKPSNVASSPAEVEGLSCSKFQLRSRLSEVLDNQKGI